MGKEVILDIKAASKLAIFLQLFVTFILALFKMIFQNDGLFFKFTLNILIYSILFIFVHEFLHGIGFKIFCNAPWKDIRYGFDKRYFTPYCSCKDLITKRNKFISVILLPTIIAGIITLIITYLSKNLFWTLVAGFVFSGGAGDIYMVYEISKYPSTYKFMDHPSEPGYIVYEV
mgnify:CR=1 FL=1|jgi:hypothetical protein